MVIRQKQYRLIPNLLNLPVTPKDADEVILLENAIRARGAIERPFLVANMKDEPNALPILLDGNRRDHILDKLRSEGLEIEDAALIVEPSVTTLDEARRFTSMNQLSQRNLTDAQRIAALLDHADLMNQLREDAARRKLKGIKVASDTTQGRVSDIVAFKTGTNPSAVKAVQAVKKVDNAALAALVADKKASKLFPGKDRTRRLLISGESLESLLMRDEVQMTEAADIARYALGVAKDQARLQSARERIPNYKYSEDGYENRIICGESSEVLAKIDDAPFIDFTFTSPPYVLPDGVTASERQRVWEHQTFALIPDGLQSDQYSFLNMFRSDKVLNRLRCGGHR